MSSFFRDSDDSDDDRTETPRPTLEGIRIEKHNSKHGENNSISEKDAGYADFEGLSEEQELEALRNNVRFKTYAIASHKQAELTKQRERLRHLDNLDRDEEPHEDAENADIPTSQIAVSRGREGANAMREVQRDPNGSNLVSASKADKVGKKERQMPKIDPKIIADSSDEDSDSEEDDDSEVPLGPVLPPSTTSVEMNRSNIEELPIHNQAELGNSHDSYVSCLALDSSGTRLVSGSLDSTAKLWDFHSMNRSLRSFRTVTPLFESPIRSVQYSSTSRSLLFCGGHSSAVITNREGAILSQTAKGDMYIVDSSRTKGHTGPILAAKWKPSGDSPSSIVVTASADATIRVWNIERARRVPMVSHPVIEQQKVIKLRNERGGRVIASSLDWLPDEKYSILGCDDGRLRIVDQDSYSLRPVAQTATFVIGGEEVTSVVCAPQFCTSPLVLVRSTDNYLRVFDRRKFETPMTEFGDLPNSVSETNACFVGQTGDHFMTGTSANRKGGTLRGSVRLFDTKRMEEVWKSELEESAGSAIYTMWHPSINQCMLGTGDGKVHVMYHPSKSEKGVLNCLSKSDFRKTHGMVSLGPGTAVPASSLHGRGRSLAAFNGKEDGRLSKKQKLDISKARKPMQVTVPTPLVQKSSATMAEHLSAKDISSEWSQDPRAAILKYADVARRDPQFTKAYKKTQPEVILAEKTAEQEEEDTRRAIYERDRTKRRKT